MIRLTALHYKIKVESLEKYHNIAEYNAGRIFEWEKEVERANSFDSEYPKKPFVEPFEFEEEDYTITEKELSIKPGDISSYKENIDNIVEVTVTTASENIIYTVRETMSQLDSILQE